VPKSCKTVFKWTVQLDGRRYKSGINQKVYLKGINHRHAITSFCIKGTVDCLHLKISALYQILYSRKHAFFTLRLSDPFPYIPFPHTLPQKGVTFRVPYAESLIQYFYPGWLEDALAYAYFYKDHLSLFSRTTPWKVNQYFQISPRNRARSNSKIIWAVNLRPMDHLYMKKMKNLLLQSL